MESLVMGVLIMESFQDATELGGPVIDNVKRFAPSLSLSLCVSLSLFLSLARALSLYLYVLLDILLYILLHVICY